MAIDYREPQTLPQELIDLILDFTDKKSLKACARAARSFRHTSQKHIFSDITLKPVSRLLWDRSRYLTLKGFAQILSASPHLALNVRSLTLVEGTGLGSTPWIRTDTVPPILSMLVNLTKISLESPDMLWLDWDSFPATLVTALHSTFSLPSLTSVRLHHVHFKRSTELVSLLRCCTTIDCLDLGGVSVSIGHGLEDLYLGPSLSSLILGSSLPLLYSVARTIDVRSVRHLQTTVSTPEVETEIQHILGGTGNLQHYHVVLSHHHTTSIINLQSLPHLRTLELTLSFLFEVSPDAYDPVGWAENILATVSKPCHIAHVILNVNIDEKDLPYLYRLENLEPLLVAPEMASLRKLTVNLDSLELDFNIYGCQGDICDAFPILCDRDMLEMDFLGVT
ncbi:hypothetical protein DFH06DRAFT_1204869 [Mycena polygramma]|nr:hypothetical protein DFH06DRAFT_1204869 [Mycena polygramma]